MEGGSRHGNRKEGNGEKKERAGERRWRREQE